MQTPTGAPPRPVHVILGEALREIAAREAKLERVAAELPEARAARKALAKLLPAQAQVQPAQVPRAGQVVVSVDTAALRAAARAQTGTPLASPPSADDGAQHDGASRASGPDGTIKLSNAQRDERVLVAIRQHQPVARSVLLQETGLTHNVLTHTLNRLREGGSVVMTGDKTTARYSLAEDGGQQ